jgi:ABC-type histidine transport system ATPase subunit
MAARRDLHKSFGGNEVLRGVDLEVARGERSTSSARLAAARPPCCVP